MIHARAPFPGERPTPASHLRPDAINPFPLPDQRDALADPADELVAEPLRLLLPRGAAWGTPDGAALDPGSVLSRFWTAIGGGFADAYRALFGVAMESTAATGDKSLEDWEAELGLPDPCLAYTDSREARWRAVRVRILSAATVTPADFLALANAMGYTVTIEEPRPFEMGVSECGGEDEIAGSIAGQIEWDWIVSVEGASERNFEMGASECGVDALTDWSPLEDIECIFRRLAPAWSRPLFVYP